MPGATPGSCTVRTRCRPTKRTWPRPRWWDLTTRADSWTPGEGDGDGYDWPQREHGLHIDHRGFVWLGGNNCPARNIPGLEPVYDDQLLKFTLDGEFVMQIGRSNSSSGNADTVNLHEPADAVVHPPTNELFVADGYGNHRVAVFDADTGEFKRMWGAFGNPPLDDDNCPNITLDSVPDGPGPDQFSVVHAIRVSNDGTVYVADRENRRLQVFTLEGEYLDQIIRGDVPFARNVALSPDPEQRFLYVGGGSGIMVFDRGTLELLTTLEGDGVVGTGHHIQTDAEGNLYIAATGAGFQRLLFTGFLVGRRRKLNRSGKLAAAAVALSMFAAAGVHADDIRIINANLITMDDANPTADTILIRGNRIVSVGVASAEDGGDPEGVTVIDAGGAVAIPGIIDQHLHWNRSAITWGYALQPGRRRLHAPRTWKSRCGNERRRCPKGNGSP